MTTKDRFALTLLISAALGAGPSAHAAVPAPAAQEARASSAQRDYEWLKSDSVVQDRNFYFLTLLDASPDVRSAIAQSPLISELVRQRRSRQEASIARCLADVACKIQATQWQDAEISAFGDALASLANRSAFKKLVEKHMRPSGAFVLYDHLDDTEMIKAAWRDTALGLNQIVRIFGLGEPPIYPAIDSISFAPGDDLFSKLLEDAMLVSALATRGNSFYSESLRFSLLLLYLNERENAGFYGDLDSTQNAAARSAASRTRWKNYPYTAILVLGDGPDDAGKQLGSFGKLRLIRAVQLYHEKKAPFIIVSGGSVHPARTTVNEADVMKKELMTRYAIPESAIIMDPDARHTTTNFRNSTRLMFRYGFPMDRKSLVTTSSGHSQYASGDVFRQKARDELGYQPMTAGPRLSAFEFEFSSNLQSLQRNALDPLDP